MTFSRKDTNKSARGAQAERLAEQFLQGQGLVCIERNYRCAAGEIDLIMRDGNMLVFVEVRLRSNRFFTQAAESVKSYPSEKFDVWMRMESAPPLAASPAPATPA